MKQIIAIGGGGFGREIGELKMQLQRMENHANNLQAKASIPRY